MQSGLFKIIMCLFSISFINFIFWWFQSCFLPKFCSRLQIPWRQFDYPQSSTILFRLKNFIQVLPWYTWSPLKMMEVFEKNSASIYSNQLQFNLLIFCPNWSAQLRAQIYIMKKQFSTEKWVVYNIVFHDVYLGLFLVYVFENVSPWEKTNKKSSFWKKRFFFFEFRKKLNFFLFSEKKNPKMEKKASKNIVFSNLFFSHRPLSFSIFMPFLS